MGVYTFPCWESNIPTVGKTGSHRGNDFEGSTFVIDILSHHVFLSVLDEDAVLWVGDLLTVEVVDARVLVVVNENFPYVSSATF